MKIIIDKVDGPPPHGLTVADIWAIVNAAPPEWHRPVTIHLKATLPEHSAFLRPATMTGSRLNICSRGLTPHHARKEVLRELAYRTCGGQRKGHRLSKADLTKIDRIVEPILVTVEQALIGKIEPPEQDVSNL